MTRWLISLALLSILASAHLLPAQEVQRVEHSKAEKLAATLVEAASRLDDHGLKISPDVKKVVALEIDEHGGMIVPDAHLTADAIAKVDKEILPVGLIFLKHVTPVVVDSPIAADKHVFVTVTDNGAATKVPVMRLAIARVASRLVLLAYTGESAPRSSPTSLTWTKSPPIWWSWSRGSPPTAGPPC